MPRADESRAEAAQSIANGIGYSYRDHSISQDLVPSMRRWASEMRSKAFERELVPA